MPSGRRAVLAAFGSASVLGGTAYWQRRRLGRRDELATLRATRDVPIPTVDAGLSVAPEHVRASHERATAYLSTIEDRLESDSNSKHRDRLAKGRAELEAHPPEAATTDRQRATALAAYRTAVEYGASAWGYHHEGVETDASPRLQRAADELRAQLDAFENQYRGDSLTQVVIQSGRADELAHTASHDVDWAEEFISDSGLTSAPAWKYIRGGRMALHDANRLARRGDGPSRRSALATTVDRLAEQAATAVDSVEWDANREESASHAGYRWADIHSETDPQEYLDGGRPALALRQQARVTLVASTLSAFTETPSPWSTHSNPDLDRYASASKLTAAKERAATRIQDVRPDVEDDPLGRYLLAKAIAKVTDGDDDLAGMQDGVLRFDDEQWAKTRHGVYLCYREAALDAAQIPRIVTNVRETGARLRGVPVTE